MIGFRVSKPGINAQDALPKDRIIDSELPCLKILQSGRRDFILTNGATANHTHSISTSFPILVLVYLWNPTTSRYQMATPTQEGESLIISYEFDTTTLYLTIYNASGSSTDTHYYWFVFYA